MGAGPTGIGRRTRMRMRPMKNSVTCAVALLVSMAMFAADGLAQPAITIQFSDPSRPGTVTTSHWQGDITVTGYDGEHVVVSTANRINGLDEEEVPERAQGLRRIGGAGGMNITERNNVITIEDHALTDHTRDLTVRVPRDTSLQLATTTGEMRITAVDGEVEVHTMAGDVHLTDVSGPTVVHAQDGDVVGTFTSVTGDMPISVSTLNGEIDLTLPSSADATLAINTSQGDIYSDFDVSLETRSTDGNIFSQRASSSRIHRALRTHGSRSYPIATGCAAWRLSFTERHRKRCTETSTTAAHGSRCTRSTEISTSGAETDPPRAARTLRHPRPPQSKPKSGGKAATTKAAQTQ